MSETPDPVVMGQSMPAAVHHGTKSEDTLPVDANGNEVLTAIADWPWLVIAVGGGHMARPVILALT